MTTQRDRLAAVLHDTICPLKNVQDAVCCDWHEPDADALIARGVRVVDAEMLARAITEAAPDGPGIRAEAAAILAALDGEP